MDRDSETAFLGQIEPLLKEHDLPRVAASLRRGWSPARLNELLGSSSGTVVRAAAECLGMVGTLEHCPRLVSLLGHADAQLSGVAEDAIWGIWMRAGSAGIFERLRFAMQLISEGRCEAALEVLAELTSAEEASAEAHHQQAVALHMLERFDEARAAYHQAVALNRFHFAALAGLGHLCLQDDDYAGALRYYHRALRIHPRLAEIREIVPQLEAVVQNRSVA